MCKRLVSVGLDVGTTTTQMIVSELEVENQASAFSVPQMQIVDRKVLYRSPVYFTPLLGQDRVDGEKIRELVSQEYAQAGITPQQVDTGAIIITGETSRKENAAAVLKALAGFAGDFVAATAGPDLESVLAAKGAGAVAYSQETGKTVLHMDIGGGTSNLALIREGKIVQTGCMNVGGRLLKLGKQGEITYLSPVLKNLTPLSVGHIPTREQIVQITQMLVKALEMAAGLQPPTSLMEELSTKETATPWGIPQEKVVLSCSGGVADCIENRQDMLAFGDIGGILGQEIKNSRLCQGEYILGEETIRATVIGAGSHSAQLSGSTVFCRGVALPVKNLPVAVFSKEEQISENLPEMIIQRVREKDNPQVMLSFPGFSVARYGEVSALAEKIVRSVEGTVFVCVETDMAKALGQCICLKNQKPCLCIDRVHLESESFLDVGSFVGPALPVVVKTLVLENKKNGESV